MLYTYYYPHEMKGKTHMKNICSNDIRTCTKPDILS